jgi:hypothetical protein
VTKFFSVLECYFPSYFNVITAWEVMEHFKEEDIQAVIRNIKSHLDIHDKSFFIGSIAAIPDGIWHQTVKDKQWWIDKFNLCGMKQAPDLEEHFHNARVRFEGNLVAMRLKK